MGKNFFENHVCKNTNELVDRRLPKILLIGYTIRTDEKICHGDRARVIQRSSLSKTMPVTRVHVKWVGEKYEIDVDTDEPVLVLKTQLYTITGVEPERQKLLIKGDDTELNSLNLKEMMGTAGALPKVPETKTQFIETMTDQQLAETLKLPAGLTNNGNTCYMNATLQCLHAIPELQESLDSYSGSVDLQGSLTESLRDLYQQLNRTTETYDPFEFIQTLRAVAPEFAERDNRGYIQQDAKECWTHIVSCLSSKLKLPPRLQQSGAGTSATSASSEEDSFVQRYMTGERIITQVLTCDEAPTEPPVIMKESFIELDCHIDISTNYLMDGLRARIQEKLEKESPTLNKQSIYTKTQKISRLPAYLTIQFYRFFWKQHERIRTKIMRKVKFPFLLDVTEFCTEELKNKLLPVKTKLMELEKNQEETNKKSKLAINYEQSKEKDKKPTIDPAVIEEIEKLVDPELAKDIGANVTGLYELCAVLTHKGRSAESGHYVAWVNKKDTGKYEWLKYDDDRVSSVTKEDIQKLDGDGGGDWHIAYIALYRSKGIPKC
ncbi:10669_t:CDS:10 [Ambispora gerdemannii]|uniref:Ubiquitin carboxyl-terminal hydrolase n=1 Tax=Ambispora gerdemannii TaxID=144530 RepID=A0A9N8YLK8_9GLOM|nr:10669_t:CDS:10 [Ambispora gerdemannii]